MKKIAIILVILSLVLSLPVYAQDTQDPSVISGCHSLQAQVPMESKQLLLTAKSAILYEMNSDTLVHAWNIDEILDPTGMVKFMTALIAIEEGDLGDTVTVTQSALNTVLTGAVSVNLLPGEKLTLEELLYCVMVASANDACAVIAEYIAGSQDAFVQKMNDRAAEMGCKNTVFMDPHGLAEAGQKSTARELAMIVEQALENPVFVRFFSAKNYTVPATAMSDERLLVTTNHMMSNETVSNYYDERVTGGKPAAASIKDRSMICTAESGNSKYLCVVMSAQSVLTADETAIVSHTNFTESLALLEHGFSNYSVQQVVDAGQVLCQYGISGGENDVVMRPTEDILAVLPNQMEPTFLNIAERVDHSLLVAPIQKDMVMGSVHVSYGTVILGSCDLIAMHDVKEAGTSITPAAPAEKQTQAVLSILKVIGWIVLALVGFVFLCFLVLLAIRQIRKAKIRAVRRRRRQDRRRSR